MSGSDERSRVMLDYATPAAPVVAEHLRVRGIVIDILIIFTLTILAGAMAGFVFLRFALWGYFGWIVTGSNFVSGTIGFTLSGMRAPAGNRWPHLFWVAAGVWALGSIKVFLFGASIWSWTLSGVLVGMMMAIGGVTSIGMKRSKRVGLS